MNGMKKFLVFNIAGAFIFSVGWRCFVAPYEIGLCGFTGVATILGYLFSNENLGLFRMFLNIPFLIVSFIYLSKEFVYRTTFSILIIWIISDGIVSKIHIFNTTNDKLMILICGAVLIGTGLGMMFLVGSTSGGTDIISNLIKLKYPNVPIGRILFILDIIIISMASLVYRNIMATIYGFGVSFIYTHVLDYILYGMNNGKLILIVSNKYKEVENVLAKDIKNHIIILNRESREQQNESKAILCAINKNDIANIKERVRAIDNNVFMIISNTEEILGKIN